MTPSSRPSTLACGRKPILSAIDLPRPDQLGDEEILMFEASVGKFSVQHARESRVAKWRADGIVERAYLIVTAFANEAMPLVTTTSEAAPAGTLAGHSKSMVVTAFTAMSRLLSFVVLQ